jgi:cytochrome c553
MRKMLAAAIAAAFVPALAVFAADAKSNWEEICAKCHGPGGKGDSHMGVKLHIRDFTDAAVQAQFTDDDAFKAVKEGLKDSAGRTRMKAIEGLSDDEIRALVQYVRGLKG